MPILAAHRGATRQRFACPPRTPLWSNQIPFQKSTLDDVPQPPRSIVHFIGYQGVAQHPQTGWPVRKGVLRQCTLVQGERLGVSIHGTAVGDAVQFTPGRVQHLCPLPGTPSIAGMDGGRGSHARHECSCQIEELQDGRVLPHRQIRQPQCHIHHAGLLEHFGNAGSIVGCGIEDAALLLVWLAVFIRQVMIKAPSARPPMSQLAPCRRVISAGKSDSSQPHSRFQQPHGRRQLAQPSVGGW